MVRMGGVEGGGDGGWDHSGTGASSGGTGGVPVGGSTASDGSFWLGSKNRSYISASSTGPPIWPGIRLATYALKNGPDPSTSPNDIAYRLNLGRVFWISSLRLSRISSTPLSLSSAGLSWVRLSL